MPHSSPQTTFPKLFAACLLAYGGTKQQLARELKMTPSSLSHLAAGNTGASVDTCLLLSAACGVPASKILRAAGKDTTADLIEQLYGPAATLQTKVAMSPDERELVEKLRRVRTRSRRIIRGVIDACAVANGVLELPASHAARRLPATHIRRRA